ncbi:MAG: hypothetical protein N838_05650 [Thiohalocapsa sp. PB-PSB1]|nr:MAG: hypothetical protein N838_05650 [Thiohalocapsa sp. PB-PSB1]
MDKDLPSDGKGDVIDEIWADEVMQVLMRSASCGNKKTKSG